jgi:hypothetical protein
MKAKFQLSYFEAQIQNTFSFENEIHGWKFYIVFKNDICLCHPHLHVSSLINSLFPLSPLTWFDIFVGQHDVMNCNIMKN